MSTAMDGRMGVGDLSLSAWEMLQDELNEALEAEETRGQAHDARFAARSGRPGLVPFFVQRVTPPQVHWGHKPSIIEAPVEELPAVAVFHSQSVPASSNIGIDGFQSTRATLTIEFIVVSDRFDPEDRSNNGEVQVNRRATAYAEAIALVMIRNHDRYGPAGFGDPVSPPTVTWGEVFARPEKDGMGGRFYFQGVRMSYAFDKFTPYGGIDQPY